MQNIKEAVAAKIADIELLLEAAQCDGLELAQCEDVNSEIQTALTTLAEAVHYYVD